MEQAYVFDKKSSQFGLVKEGEYEVTIKNMTLKTLPSGKEKISVEFKIRADVEQPFAGRILFEDIWQEKDNPAFFNRRRINQLLGTQKIEDGKTFANIYELCDYLKGSNLIISVSVEYDDYNEKDINRVLFYKNTKIAAQVVTPADPKPEEPKDDDLPF